ncbi:MAG: OsmC family protein [Nitrospira sp.]|nr:OsmC family protein [Nitrospira sp.]
MSRAKVTYVQGLQFVGEAASGHAIVMDGAPEVGGHDTGLRPMELLLVALGGCTGMDVVSILKKKRQEVTGLEIALKGEKPDQHPKKFTAINLEFIVRGKNLSEEAVRRAIDLSMNKYCSVKFTLEGTAKIGFSYKILQE